ALDREVALDAGRLVAFKYDLGGFEGGCRVLRGVQEVSSLDVLVEGAEARVDGFHVDGDIDLRLFGILVQHDRTGGLVEAQDLLGHSHVFIGEARESMARVKEIGLRCGHGLPAKREANAAATRIFFMMGPVWSVGWKAWFDLPFMDSR